MEFGDKFLGSYCSKLINIRRFKEENFHTFQPIKLSKVTNRVILDQLKSINPSVDLSNLSNEVKQFDDELQKYNFQDVYDMPEVLNSRGILPIYHSIDSDLKTLKVSKSDMYQTKRTKLYAPMPSFTPRGHIVPGKTLLITVSLYYPFRWQKDQIPDDAVLPSCKEAIQFYDTQTLKDLRRAFKCENVNSEISGDISDDPHKPLEYMAINDLKHALFYINKKLYVDTQEDGKTLAHAKTVQTWAQNNGHAIEDICTLDAQFLDLEVRIGEPYVYQHLGRCEHLFIFNEISFAHPNDCLGRTNYPRVISVAKEKLKYCMFCSKSIASIVMISDNDRTPVTVNHMCEPCFMSYNYDHLGDKVADFKAYRALKYKK